MGLLPAGASSEVTAFDDGGKTILSGVVAFGSGARYYGDISYSQITPCTRLFRYFTSGETKIRDSVAGGSGFELSIWDSKLAGDSFQAKFAT